MRQASPITLVLGCLVAGALLPGAALAGPIRYGGANAELSICEVSDRTVRIVLAPLDDKGSPRAALPSTALVELEPRLKLRCRELNSPEEIVLTKLHVKVQLEP